MFRCGKCGCILSATTADIAGISKSPIGLLTTAGAANALLKRGSGKQVNVTYLRVEEVGSAQTTQLYRRRELPLEELQALAGSL